LGAVFNPGTVPELHYQAYGKELLGRPCEEKIFSKIKKPKVRDGKKILHTSYEEYAQL